MSQDQIATVYQQRQISQLVLPVSTPGEQFQEIMNILKTAGAAFSYNEHLNYSLVTQIGSLNQICSHCQALKFMGETKGMCCSGGKVILSLLKEPLQPLKSLLQGNHSESKHYLQNIRKYNSCFQMTSFGADKVISEYGFMPTFKVCIYD